MSWTAHPARMVAVCALGHRWPVRVTWHPEILRAGVWDQTTKGPEPVPRYCAACRRQGVRPSDAKWAGLARVEAAPDAPALSIKENQ